MRTELPVTPASSSGHARHQTSDACAYAGARVIDHGALELREVVPDQDKDGKALPVLTGYAAKFNVSHCRWA